VWIIGVAIALVGIYLNGLALNYGTVVLLSSTTGFTLIFSDILAPIVFGEKFTWGVDGLIAGILIVGSSICAM